MSSATAWWIAVRRWLLGVNHSGTEYACVKGTGIFEGPQGAALASAIVSWHANTVRIPLNEDC